MIYSAWTLSMLQLRDALQEDSKLFSPDHSIPPIGDTLSIGFPRTTKWLSWLLRIEKSLDNLEALKTALPQEKKLIIILDEFFSTRISNTHGNSSGQAYEYLMRGNEPLILRQILRGLKLPFIVMGTNASWANVVMAPKASTSGDEHAEAFVMVTCSIDESPPNCQKTEIEEAVKVLLETVVGDEESRCDAVKLLSEMTVLAKPRLRCLMLEAIRQLLNKDSEERMSFAEVLDNLRSNEKITSLVSRLNVSKLFCRSALIVMQLSASRAVDTLCAQWFDDDQANLSSTLGNGLVTLVRGQKTERMSEKQGNTSVVQNNKGTLRSEKGEEWRRYAIYRPLEEDMLFHLTRCGRKGWLFCNGDNQNVRLLQGFREYVGLKSKNAVSQEMFKNCTVPGSDGTQLEVFLCLGVIAASQSEGFAERPSGHTFLQTALREWTALEIPLQPSQQLNDAFGIATVPFGSPVNTPWPENYASCFEKLDIILGNTSRPKNDKGVDLLLEPIAKGGNNMITVSGEAKDRAARIDFGLMREMLKRVPDQEPLLHIIVTCKTCTQFHPDSKKSLVSIAEKNRFLVFEVSPATGKEEWQLKKLISYEYGSPAPKKIVILISLITLSSASWAVQTQQLLTNLFPIVEGMMQI